MRLIEMKETFIKATIKLDSRVLKWNVLLKCHVHWIVFIEKGVKLKWMICLIQPILLLHKRLNIHCIPKEYVCQKVGRVSLKKELFIAQVCLVKNKIKNLKNYKRREYIFSGPVGIVMTCSPVIYMIFFCNVYSGIH